MKTASSLPQEVVLSQPGEFLRDVVQRNRRGEAAGTYAVCSAHPAVLDAAIRQSLADGTVLHVESTSSQVNQYGGYTGSTPAQFARFIRGTAEKAGLPSARVLLGSDHLGPYYWRKEPAATAMVNACELAAQCVLAGYQKIHLDASMACGGDPAVLPVATVAERTSILCQVAEESFASLPKGSPRPLYVIGTEVPVPGGEVAEGEPPLPTTLKDLQQSLGAFRAAFAAHGLKSAWENVIGMVVQPGVEFGDTSIFEYDPKKAQHLVKGLPAAPELVYEAHSTDYQTPLSLARLVKDHFAILKVGPWLTFAYREAVFALGLIESEMPEHKQGASRVREVLEAEMLRNPANWKPYYHGDDAQQKFARAFSLSDRCRYYWPQPPIQKEVDRLLHNLGGPLPLALLSQYLPCEYDAIRDGSLDNSASAIIRQHIQRVLKVYAAACGALAG
jgi:D-tagatose-1,6-bisphosphate aldolase subunit GatZ/KbaZ